VCLCVSVDVDVLCMFMTVQRRKLSDGLFLECCRATAEEYSSIQFENMIIDNTCMQVGRLLISEFLPCGMHIVLPLYQMSVSICCKLLLLAFK